MMSSGPHASVYPQPPPFPQHGHSNSMNGSFSQLPTNSFDASLSIASTPAPTPPPPRPGSQHQMAYGMNGTPMGNSTMQRGSFSYPDPTSTYAPAPPPAPSSFYGNGAKPQIYTVRMDKLGLRLTVANFLGCVF